jgi:hypothetical protein
VKCVVDRRHRDVQPKKRRFIADEICADVSIAFSENQIGEADPLPCRAQPCFSQRRGVMPCNA